MLYFYDYAHQHIFVFLRILCLNFGPLNKARLHPDVMANVVGACSMPSSIPPSRYTDFTVGGVLGFVMIRTILPATGVYDDRKPSYSAGLRVLKRASVYPMPPLHFLDCYTQPRNTTMLSRLALRQTLSRSLLASVRAPNSRGIVTLSPNVLVRVRSHVFSII